MTTLYEAHNHILIPSGVRHRTDTHGGAVAFFRSLIQDR